MKPKIFIVGILILLITCLIVFFQKEHKPEPPPKLSNIPRGAVWRGGVDGGFWFYFVGQETDTTSRLRIYDEHQGYLIIDANFKSKTDCSVPEGKTILDSINHFDFTNIILLNKCSLIPVKPVFF